MQLDKGSAFTNAKIPTNSNKNEIPTNEPSLHFSGWTNLQKSVLVNDLDGSKGRKGIAGKKLDRALS